MNVLQIRMCLKKLREELYVKCARIPEDWKMFKEWYCFSSCCTDSLQLPSAQWTFVSLYIFNSSHNYSKLFRGVMLLPHFWDEFFLTIVPSYCQRYLQWHLPSSLFNDLILLHNSDHGYFRRVKNLKSRQRKCDALQQSEKFMKVSLKNCDKNLRKNN